MNIIKIIKKYTPVFIKELAFHAIRYINIIIYQHKNKLKKINTSYNLIEIGESKKNTFFGYYDITPFQGNNIIYLECTSLGAPAKIILNNLDGNKRKQIGETRAWNTQQGCRLRWMPNSNNIISFNDFIDNNYVNRIINISTGEEKRLNYPLYDISRDGKFGLTLNFERLGVLRPGYGYTNRSYDSTGNLDSESIDIINLSSGDKRKLITYADISRFLGENICDFSFNYINHLSFSPNGKKFLFFWIKNIANWAEVSLLVYDIPLGIVKVYERDLRVSHYTWLDNDTILCTATSGKPPHISTQYYIYKEGQQRRVYGGELLNRDGHPSAYNEHIILSDTYPDKYLYQELFLYDRLKNKKKRLVYSYSKPVVSEELRTDMHPRFNENNSIICYDANVSGYRHIYLLKDWSE
jgi:hypothetical protein